ncbi:ATP-dependent DNA helicase [Trichonephila clavipes]|nr:ATP-dependent DNA helicase [Trichonephila clavipes]
MPDPNQFQDLYDDPLSDINSDLRLAVLIKHGSIAKKRENLMSIREFSCASTGKAAVSKDGTTVHTALKIYLSKFLPLSVEVVHQYRALYRYIRVLIVDEISMVDAELLS